MAAQDCVAFSVVFSVYIIHFNLHAKWRFSHIIFSAKTIIINWRVWYTLILVFNMFVIYLSFHMIILSRRTVRQHKKLRHSVTRMLKYGSSRQWINISLMNANIYTIVLKQHYCCGMFLKIYMVYIIWHYQMKILNFGALKKNIDKANTYDALVRTSPPVSQNGYLI